MSNFDKTVFNDCISPQRLHKPIKGVNNSGAVFNLMTRDGPQDELLTALDRLDKRLQAIKIAKTLLNENPIPTLAEIDETHVFFIKHSFKPYIPVASEYSKVGPITPFGFGKTVKFELPEFGDFISDQVLRIVISPFGLQNGDANTDITYRYATLPGLKIAENIEFSCGNVKIDNYTNMDMLFQSNFMLEGYKKLALARAVGQQDDKYAAFYMPDNQIYQEIKYTDGAQTPKTYQPRMELWLPLVFWHNLLAANALSNRMLPWGQRNITIQVAALEGLITARAPGGVDKTPIPEDVKKTIQIEAMELYTNNLFIGADIHDIYIKRLKFNMIRVHGRTVQPATIPDDRILLSDFKWPTEFMYVGFRPRANNTPEKWTDLVFLKEKSFITPIYQNNIVVPQTVTYKDKFIPIKTLSVISAGVSIFPKIHTQFYEDFLPFARSNTAVGLRGAFLIPFNLKTGELQPSGYFSMARNRETYLEWTGGLFNKDNPAEVFVSAMQINFLVIKDNKAFLLY
jgi:hypothetical protein